MGEAKRRGNKEQRIAEAREIQDFNLLQHPETVDEELFLYCSNIYSAAAQMTMPVENPASKPLFRDKKGTYSFSDIPLNRGCLAVTKELIDMGQPINVRHAMITRLMQFGDVLKPNPLLSKWIKPGEAEDELNVAESLIRACAVAKIIITENSISFDMEDVARLSAEIEEKLEAEEKSKNG